MYENKVMMKLVICTDQIKFNYIIVSHFVIKFTSIVTIALRPTYLLEEDEKADQKTIPAL